MEKLIIDVRVEIIKVGEDDFEGGKQKEIRRN